MLIKVKQSCFFITMLIAFCLHGCEKEPVVEPSKIDEIVGNYFGEKTSNSGWSLAGGEISKYSKDTLIMNYWRPTPIPIKMKVSGNKLETKNQEFASSWHTNNPWKVYYVTYRLSLNGYYRNDSIFFTFEEELKREGDSIFQYYDNGHVELHRVEQQN